MDVVRVSHAGLPERGARPGQDRPVQLSGVAVRYGRRAPWVLQKVDLDLPHGALLEVTGRNGAGKSSLLRVLAGVLRPASGRVTGRPASVGWAPERFPAAQPHRTGDHLRAQARVRGLGADADRAVAREAERWGLEPLLAVPLFQLSKGSAQKVGLAQALLAPVGLLVLDEPWSGLDAGARAAVPGVVREVVGRGGSVVVADHQQQVAALAPHQRWHVADGTVGVTSVPAAAASVVEVDVPAADLPAVLAELRRRGLAPRLR